MGTHQLIFDVVRRIPAGRVATYGQVARLAGLAGHARQVGYALAALDEDDPAHRDVPWHRVINARGEVSTRAGGGDHGQRARLEAEGVAFDARGRVPLAACRWTPGESAER